MPLLVVLLLGVLTVLTGAEPPTIPGLPVPPPGDILSAAEITDCLTRLANATASLSASPFFPGAYPRIAVPKETIESNTALFQSVFTRSYCANVVDLLSGVAMQVEDRAEPGGSTARRDAQRRRLASNVTLEVDVDPDNSKFPSRGDGYDRFSAGTCPHRTDCCASLQRRPFIKSSHPFTSAFISLP